MFGSSVLPDLEETMNSVLPRSIACSIVLICAGSVLICFLATIYPSAQAARVDPAEAIRYE